MLTYLKGLPSGEIFVPRNNIKQAKKLNLEVGIQGTDYMNDWDIWVYPVKLSTPEPQSITFTQNITTVAIFSFFYYYKLLIFRLSYKYFHL